MAISVISDIHMRPRRGIEWEVFEKFSSHKLVQSSNTIVFLGDIFDVLIGGHRQYLNVYQLFFDFVAQSIARGQEIHYVEGNHDLHLSSLLHEVAGGSQLLHYHKGGFFKNFRGKNIFFSHGDDIDTTDPIYTYYRRLLSSNFFKLLGEAFIPYSFVESIGHRAAQKSREKNHLKYDSRDNSALKTKFRTLTDKAHKHLRFDVLICGHIHIKDEFHSPEGFTYFNNGYAPREQSFICIEPEGISFVSL